ncbi:unnamed protein product [Symbiodinium sp. CCMP2592]|nr:unnamed protein product [Symbiodinium sp. CCMP2592]
MSVQQDLASCQSIQDISDCLTSALQQHLPPRSGSTRLAPWQSPAMQGGIRAMWAHYRQWRQAASRQTSTICRAWFRFAKFQKAHRGFRRAAKHAWYSDRLQELGTHARRHNIRALYQGVQRLAPKKRFVQVQLRAPDGGLIFAEKQAVPEHLAPIAAWRLCSDVVMPKLAEIVNNLTAVDELWHVAWLALIPKITPQNSAGGLQLSLDLSSAFDHMEWAHIVLEWYRDIKYVLTIQGQTVDIPASRGLKQGCLIAPLIWSLVTGRFLYELALCTDPLWVTADVTTYADDFHAGQLLDVLCAAGLTVNAQKSAVLRLRTPKGLLFEFPVAEVHTYLGVRISYKNPRLATLQYRVQLVQAEWSRLRKVVCSKRGLFLKDRLNIWRASTLPMLTYGLAATGLPAGGLQQLRTLYLRQLRAILRSPAHLSHVSNDAILEKAGVLDVSVLITRDLQRLQANLWQLQAADSSLLASCVLRFAEGLQTSLDSQPPPRGHAPGARECEPEAILECRFCGETFATYHLRRAHEARKHQVRTTKQAVFEFDRYKHSIDGMPTCGLCRYPFRKWSNLRNHIARGQCPFLCSQKDATTAVPVQPLTRAPADPEALEMTAQERQFFGGVCPSLQPKRDREEGPSEKRPRTADALTAFHPQAAVQMPQDHWPAGQGSWSTPWTSEYGIPDMIQKLTSLAIKHEYAINSMMQDHTLYLFVKPGDEGLLPILFATSLKVERHIPGGSVFNAEPLRLVMMKAFLIELGQRLKATKDQQESTQKAKELGWLTDQGQWKTLVWDPTTQDLKEKQGGKRHSTDDLIGQSVELRKIITDETLFRFQSLRGLSRAPQTAWVQLAIEISVRDMGNRVWEILHSWIGCAALHTMGCRLRRERGGLSQQARALRGCLSYWNVRDDIPGLSQILRCLLWPLWCDTARSQHVHGLLKHLWHRICTTPDALISLKGDLLWSAVAGGIPSTAQAPHLRAQLQYLLQQLALGDLSGLWEWCETGVTATPASEQADLTIPMPIIFPVQPDSTAGGLWGWGDSAFRPVLRTAPPTLYTYVYNQCAGSALVTGPNTLQAWLAAAGEACTLTIEPTDGPSYQCLYEARSVILHRPSGDPCIYFALHRKLCDDVLSPFAPALTEADTPDMWPLVGTVAVSAVPAGAAAVSRRRARRVQRTPRREGDASDRQGSILALRRPVIPL